MIGLVLKNLRHETGRFAGSVGGVASSALLVLIVVGLFEGFMAASTAYVDRAGADVWVSQEGSIDMFHSVSLLPAELADQVIAVPGVADATPILGRSFRSHAGDLDVSLYLIGFDQESGVGGPGSVTKGRIDVGPDEIIVSRIYTDEVGVGIGDRIHVAGRDFTIVGIASIPTMGLYSYAFIDLATAREAFRMQDLASYLLVTIEPGADAARVAAAIDVAVDGVSVRTSEDFGEENGRAIREVFVPMLGAIVAIALVVGIAVIGLTSWSAVNERAAEYAVLKAIGVGNGRLFRLVVLQSAFAALLGALVGFPLAWGASRFLVWYSPRITILIEAPLLGWAAAGALVVAVAASAIPMRRIARIDPAEVFWRG